jgi:hypothetical protein
VYTKFPEVFFMPMVMASGITANVSVVSKVPVVYIDMLQQ